MSIPIVIGGTSDGRFDRVAQLFKAIDDLKAENARLLELLGRLSLEEGNYKFAGTYPTNHYICVYCHEIKGNPHSDDCPWLEARKVLEER